jgi:hypothetical protein
VRWQELALRLALIVGLFVAITYEVNVWILAPLGLIGIAATAELAIRNYVNNAVDRLLLGCGTVVTVFILAGLLLNLTPWGLTRMTWAVFWTTLSIGVLAWRRKLGINVGRPGAIRPFGPWLFSAILLFALAGVLAIAGVRAWSEQPVLAFAFSSTNSNDVVVEIDSTSINDIYRIVAKSKVSGAHQYSSKPLTVRSPGTGSRLYEHVPVNVDGIWTIDLESANTGAVVRWLRVDVKQH